MVEQKLLKDVLIEWVCLGKYRQFRGQLAWKFTAHFTASLAATNTLIILSGAVTRNTDGCTVVAVLLHYFALSMFCWMWVQSALLMLKIVFVFAVQPDHLHFKMAALGWG